MAEESLEQMTDRIVAACEGFVAVQVAKQMRNIATSQENQFLRLLQAMEIKLNNLHFQNERHREHLAALERKIKQHA